MLGCTSSGRNFRLYASLSVSIALALLLIACIQRQFTPALALHLYAQYQLAGRLCVSLRVRTTFYLHRHGVRFCNAFRATEDTEESKEKNISMSVRTIGSLGTSRAGNSHRCRALTHRQWNALSGSCSCSLSLRSLSGPPNDCFQVLLLRGFPLVIARLPWPGRSFFGKGTRTPFLNGRRLILFLVFRHTT
jgi:hypothetical protein